MRSEAEPSASRTSLARLLEPRTLKLNQFCFSGGKAIRQERCAGRCGSIGPKRLDEPGRPPPGNPKGRVNLDQILRASTRPCVQHGLRRTPRPWSKFPPAEWFHLRVRGSRRAGRRAGDACARQRVEVRPAPCRRLRCARVHSGPDNRARRYPRTAHEPEAPSTNGTRRG